MRPHTDEMDLLHASISAITENRRGLEIEVIREGRKAQAVEVDATLRLRHPGWQRAFDVAVEVKRTHLTYAIVEGTIARLRSLGKPWLLCAPYVAPPMSRYLADRHISFIDRTGNCHIEIDGMELLHHVEARRQPATPSSTAVRAAGYNVMLAILMQPELLHSDLRTIRASAGVSIGTVSNHLRRLQHDGFIAKFRERYELVRPRALLDKWVTGYADVLRPSIFVGRYEVRAQDIATVERMVAEALGEDDVRRSWWWGGASGAFRLVRHYHAPLCTIHTGRAGADVVRRLRALPSPTGKLQLLRLPSAVGSAGLPGHDDVVHPVLLYAEMMTSDDERTHEAAAQLRDRFLEAYR